MIENNTIHSYIDWVGALSLLGFIFIFGTIGNFLVVGVYLQHLFCPRHQRRTFLTHSLSYSTRQSGTINFTSAEDNFTESTSGREMTTPTFFILVLAIVDLIVCCCVVPLTFYLEYIDMATTYLFLCKIQTFTSVSNTMFSSLLVIAIALDRYFAICHPLRRFLTMGRAKILTAALAIFCCAYGGLGQSVITLGTSTHYPDNITRCMESGEQANSTNNGSFYYTVIQKGNTSCFLLAILCVLILYSLILRAALHAQRRIRKYNMTLVNGSSVKNDTSTTNHVQIPGQNGISARSNIRRPATRASRFPIRVLPSNALWQEVRSALVLFVVAVVYIIVFTPSLLIANRIVPLTLIGANTYYLNNMSNPLIYCFMSQAFRQKLRLLLCGSCTMSNSSQEDSWFSSANRRKRGARLETSMEETN